MPKTREELIDEYVEAMADGDFAVEFREGSNMAKFLTPEQIQNLADAQEEAAAKSRRRNGSNIFRRIR